MAMILVFFGMTASGKSTLAEACAARYNAPYFNTDRVRKELAGLAATTRRPDGIDQGIYSRELSAQTYSALVERAEVELKKKGERLVLLDGSYASLAERERVRLWAEQLGVEFRFIHCWCSEEETRRRLQLRAQDPQAVSDGRWEIYQYQLDHFTRPQANELDIIPCNTEAPPEELLTQLVRVGILPHSTA